MGLALALLVILSLHAAGLNRLAWLDRAEAMLYDLRVRSTATKGVDERIVVLDIDERSLAHPALGRWPWSRDRMAELVDILFEHYGLGLLAFDVVHAEPDRSDGFKALEAWADEDPYAAPLLNRFLTQRRALGSNDSRFAQAVGKHPVVLGYYFAKDPMAGTSGVLPPAVTSPSAITSQVPSWAGFGANLPLFSDAVSSAGHFNGFIEPDGVVRRFWMLAEHEGRLYEALSLASIRLLAGQPELELHSAFAWPWQTDPAARRMSGLTVAGLHIPTDAHSAALIPFRGPVGSFRYISLADVLDRTVAQEDLKGRIGVLGSSTPGQLDLRSTPVNEVYPGVEIHANLISGALDGNMPRLLPYPRFFETSGILLLGAFALWLLPRLRLVAATASLCVLLAAFVLGPWLVWSQAAIWVPMASPLVLLVLLFADNIWWGYWREARRRNQFADLFGQYVPKALVAQMARDPKRYSMEGRAATLTIMFADIRGFAHISEGMESKQLAAMINEYLSEMSALILSHGGTVDKYIGDALMAFWGAPIDDPAHARRAVQAGLAMQSAMPALNRRLVQKGWPEIEIGIGINTGLVTVGDMGSNLRRAYTVMGDAVNVASRLEGLTKQYGVDMLVGDGTRAALKEHVFVDLGQSLVKGREEPVRVFYPMGPKSNMSPEEEASLGAWQMALLAHRRQDWHQTDEAIATVLARSPNSSTFRQFEQRWRNSAERRNSAVKSAWW